MSVPAAEAHRRLTEHLRAWLGAWPPDSPLVVTTCRLRTEPGWDGSVVDVAGVASPAGAVLSVPPDRVAAVAALGRTLDDVEQLLGPVLGRPGAILRSAAFRWCDTPADLADAGTWVACDDPRLPEWLRPFGGEALVAFQGDEVVAGVGIKRHDEHGWELAVVTEEAARGRGLARRLVAQAARRVLDEGKVPTYLHDFRNRASARVAEAAGFPDRGWRVLGVWG